MNTAIKVQGFLRVTVVDSKGNEKVVFDDHNLIVDSGLSGLANLVSGTTSNPITILKAGDGNTAPSATDTVLSGAQVGPDKSFSVVTVDSGGTPGLIDFQTSLGTGEGNGSTIQEVGLFFSDGTMFSRQVIGAVTKTSAITVTFNWRIQFSR